MSKIHLLQNKEIVIAIVVLVAVLILVIMNITLLVPTVFTVYRPDSTLTNRQLIDAESVNKAIEFLGE